MTAIHALGSKCTCAGCAARFYDMNKKPAICPKCGKKAPIIVKAASRRRRSVSDRAPDAESAG